MAKCYITESCCPFRRKKGAEKVEESHIEVRGRIFFLKPRGGGQSRRYSGNFLLEETYFGKESEINCPCKSDDMLASLI